jgi:hypothetical protein
VNEAIAATVRERPADLFYLNNGLTAVCSEIVPPPAHTFLQVALTLRGFSVVNGAQTVGSVFAAQAAGNQISPDAKLLITLIEVGAVPGNLGVEITRCRNTQMPASMVFPRPTSSAKIAPLESGERNANKAASI